MLFNSLEFLIFLPLVWACYHTLSGARSRAYLLLAASYVFYMWWRVDYAVLLLLSTLTDYTCGRMMGRRPEKSMRRFSLGLSLFVNLSLLISFKYWNFLAGTVTSLGRYFSSDFRGQGAHGIQRADS